MKTLKFILQKILIVEVMLFQILLAVERIEENTLDTVVLALFAALLIVTAMGQIHEFSFGKNILFTIFTLFAMLVMIFILMIFFSMISQGVAYFISLGKEFLFRL